MSAVAHLSLDDELGALLAADERALVDPYPLYRRLLEDEPVYRYGGMTIVSPHHLVKEVYRDATRFQKHPSRTAGMERKFALLGDEDMALMREIQVFEEAFLSRKNGADHVRVRSAVGRFFTPRQIAALEERVVLMVDELLAPMDLLGAPREDADALKHWGDAIQRPQSRTPVEPEDVREAHEGLEAYRAYSQELVARHRLDPDHGPLVEGLLGAAGDERLTEHELVAFFLHTMFAGHETTANLISNGLVALLEHRGEWERLCADPTLAGIGTEELLRFEPPSQLGTRLVAVDTEIAGVPLAEGSTVLVMIAGANRDPAVFAEPARLDLTRAPNDHLALAFGAHFCLGASVARMEGRLAFAELARRFPRLELAVERSELRRNRHAGLRGFQSVPVHLGAR